MSALVDAQVPPPPLKNVRIDSAVGVNAETKVFTYRYRVTNLRQNVLSVSLVKLDITLPPNSIRPTGSAKLPAGAEFRDPDGPKTLPPSELFPFSSWGDYYRGRLGLDFVPVGLFSPLTWTEYSVVSTPKESLLGKGMAGLWIGVSETLQSTGLGPGGTLDGFVVTSFGPPGIRRIELQPMDVELMQANLLPPEWLGQEEDSAAVLLQKERLIKSLGYVTSTVGPTALPAGYTNAALVTRLQGYVDQAAGLSWIMDQALVQQLTGFLTQTSAALQQNQAVQAKTLLRQFATAVTSASLAQRRQEASDLLSLNAQFIIDHITVVSPTTSSVGKESPGA
jgi:hypothetical protein